MHNGPADKRSARSACWRIISTPCWRRARISSRCRSAPSGPSAAMVHCRRAMACARWWPTAQALETDADQPCVAGPVALPRAQGPGSADRSCARCVRGGTSLLADAAAEMADRDFADFDSGGDPYAYLRSRAIIAADAGIAPGAGHIVVTEDFLVGRQIPLGPLLDMTARALDLLDNAYCLFDDAAGGVAARSLAHRCLTGVGRRHVAVIRPVQAAGGAPGVASSRLAAPLRHLLDDRPDCRLRDARCRRAGLLGLGDTLRLGLGRLPRDGCGSVTRCVTGLGLRAHDDLRHRFRRQPWLTAAGARPSASPWPRPSPPWAPAWRRLDRLRLRLELGGPAWPQTLATRLGASFGSAFGSALATTAFGAPLGQPARDHVRRRHGSGW